MKSVFLPITLLAGLIASACVTINVYFPAAAAQAAADRVIDEVWGDSAAPASSESGKPVSGLQQQVQRLAAAVLNGLLPSAHAADPDLDVSSPAIKELTANMEARFASLAPHLDSGAIGVAQDGYLALRDPNAVPLAQRNPLRKLVANENADRKQLYREIAEANGHPEWEEQIRAVFAKRWIARAKAGWHIETDAGWRTK